MGSSRSVEKGKIEIKSDRCKGCQLCIPVCPIGLVKVSEKLNDMGYHPAQYTGNGCTGCGLCYTVCPEPGCITVYREGQ